MDSRIYYPSVVIALGFRWDSTFRLKPDSKPDLSALQKDSRQSFVQLVAEPLFLQGAKDDLTWLVNLVPRSCQVTKPGFKKAGTVTCELSFKDLPIDPWLVRAAQIRVFVGCVTAEDFATGMTSVDKDVRGRPVRRSIISTHDAEGNPYYDKLALWGVVDKWKTRFTKDDMIVHIEGRDLRAIFLESPIDSKELAKIKLNQPIDKVVADILGTHPLAEGMEIHVQPTDWDTGLQPGEFGPPDPLPYPVAAGSLVRPRKTANGQGAQHQPPEANNKLKMWDWICQVCQPKDALVWREDLTWAPISEIRKGDRVLGFAKAQAPSGKRWQKYEAATVEAVSVRKAPVVALHMESGRIVRCTPDHNWFTGRSEPKYMFAPPQEGRPLVRVYDAPEAPFAQDPDYQMGYVRGLIAGDGCFVDNTYVRGGKKSRTKHITVAMRDQDALARYVSFCRTMGLNPREGARACIGSGRLAGKVYQDLPYARMCTQQAIDMLIHAAPPSSVSYARGWLAGIFDAEGCVRKGTLQIGQSREVNPDVYADIVRHLSTFGFRFTERFDRVCLTGGLPEILRFHQVTQPAATRKFYNALLDTRMRGQTDRVLKIELCGEEEVVSLQTTTNTYFGQGYASRNCYLVGAVPYFRGKDLMIRPAKKIYSLRDKADVDPNIKGPFNKRVRNINGHNYAIRQLVYGLDLVEIEFERKFVGGQRPRVIQCIGVDTGSDQRGKDKLVEVFYPEDVYKKLIASKQQPKTGDGTKGAPSGQLSENEVYRYPVPGIVDKKQLKQIAEAIFESIARKEVEGKFSTKKLSSLGGDNSDPDLLRIEPGDPVEFSVFQQTLGARRLDDRTAQNDRTRSAGRSTQEEIDEVKQRVGDRDLAAAIVATRRDVINEVQRIYRVHDVHLSWSHQGGIEVSCEFHNYIEATYDPPGGSDQAPAKPKQPLRKTKVQRKQSTTPEDTGSVGDFRTEILGR